MKKAIVPLGILLLVIFGVFMYINRFTIFHTSDIDGIVFATNDMATNLAAGVNDESPKITYENLKINETIYKSGKKFYIGEETKKNVNLDYPIVSTDTSSLLILNDKGNFVDETFVKSETYENTILNEGTLYNGINNTKVSDDKFIFLEVGNGIYVNLVEMNVKRRGEDHKIPINSFIYFEQSFLRFYSMKNGVYKFTELAGVEDATDTFVGETKYDYYDFLVYLGVITPKEDKQEEIIEEILTPEEQKSEIQAETKPPSGIIVPNEPYNPGNNFSEEEYIKPEARIRNTSTNVYSYKGHIEIYDPVQKIAKAPTVEFKIGKQVKLRFMYSKTMDFEAIGLEPDTEYEVEAYFMFYGADGTKYKTTFFTESIKTKDISTLETLKLEIKNVEPEMKKVKIGSMKLNNNKNDEVLKGIKFATISFNNIHIKMSQGTVMNLASLREESYETGEALNSGTPYHTTIVFEDTAGNKLKVTGNEFDFETLKTPPIAKIGVTLSNNFTLAEAKIEMTNPDKVEGSRYRYELFDYATQKSIQAGALKAPEEAKNQSVNLTNLNAETKYVFRVFCDYIDNSNGKLIRDYMMEEYTFQTFDAARLGTIPFNIQEYQISETTVVIDVKFLQYSSSNPVYELIDDKLVVTFENKDDPNEVITKMISKSEFIVGTRLTFDNLSSNSTYEMRITPQITTSCNVNGACEYYPMPTRPEVSGYTTDKAAATVFVRNGFVASKYVDFDICIEDPDQSISREKPVQVNFKKVENGIAGTVVDTYDILPKDSCAPTTKNADNEFEDEFEAYDRINATTNLDAGQKYQINVFAQEYNLKHTSNTKTVFNYYINNLTASGTSGNLKLVGLTNEINYQLAEDTTCSALSETNLFDISNYSRWKVTYHGESVDDKEIKIDSKEIILKSYRGYTAYSYYLPELQGRSYTLRYDYEFEAGWEGDKVTIITDDNFGSGGGIQAHTSSGSGKFKEIIVSQVGKYLTFYVSSNEDKSRTTTFKLKNVQINCSTAENVEYNAFGGDSYTNQYVGEFYAYFNGLMEQNFETIEYPEYFNEKPANEYKYYVKYYLNGEPIEEAEGDTISTDNLLPADGEDKIVQQLIKRKIIGNRSLEARLGVSVEVAGKIREYDLKTINFSSEAETRTIRSAQDFVDMHAYGYYLVDLEGQTNTCTLEVNKTGSCMSLTGKQYGQLFQGNIDFQGNKVEVLVSGTQYSGIFSQVGGGATIKNLDLHLHIQTTKELPNSLASPITKFSGLTETNNGTVTNIKVGFSGYYQPRKYTSKYKKDPEDPEKEIPDKEWIQDLAHKEFSLLTQNNKGTIENFMIDMQSELILGGKAGLVAITNYGTIRNGYIVGKNINIGYEGGGNTGVFVYSNSYTAKIYNVYSIIDIVVKPPQYEEGYKVVYNLAEFAEDKEVVIENPVITTKAAANIAYTAGGIIENAVIVDPRYVYHEYGGYDYETNRIQTSDPLVYSGSTKSKNLNFIHKDIYGNGYSRYQLAVVSHLKEGTFMETVLNSDKMFNTKEASAMGQFPRLLWNDFMPEQPIIKVPEPSANDRMKILSVNKVTQASPTQKFVFEGHEYAAEVKFSVYNPNNLRLVGIELYGFEAEDVKIVSRTEVNSAMQQMVTVYINEPQYYQKNYSVKEVYINEPAAGNVISNLTKACNQADKPKLDNTTEFDCAHKPTLTLDLYLEVESLNEIIEAVEDYTHTSFSLTKDIDFSKEEFKDEPKYIEFLESVTIKGNNHTIKNLTTENCFFRSIYDSEIIDLNFENYTVEYGTNGKLYYDLWSYWDDDWYPATNYAGLICDASGGTIDDVHVKNEELVATGTYNNQSVYIGGLIGNAGGVTIKNSSVTNVHFPVKDMTKEESIRNQEYIDKVKMMQYGNLYVGGLVGYSYNVKLSNSFARKVNFVINKYDAGVDHTNFSDYTFGFQNVHSAGGLVGYASGAKIENVYATGTVDSKIDTGDPANVGGLVGWTDGSITSAISYVNVYTMTPKIGGMIGNTSDSLKYKNVASKTLVLGDVLTSATTGEITQFRTSYVPIEANKNFAWYRQAMNSKVSANTSNEELLNDEDLSNPAIYSTKIGLSPNDFTLDLDNYRKVAYDKDDNIYEVSYDTPLKEVENEEESFDVVDVKTGETVKVMEVHGTLPKLMNSETGEVLPNQDVGFDTVVNYIELFSISKLDKPVYINVDPGANGTYEYEDVVEAMKDKANNYDVVNYLGRVVEVTAYIKNPNKLEMTEIIIEDMDILNTIDPQQDPDNDQLYKVVIYAKPKPNKNKESYNITCIKYFLQGEPREYRSTIKFNISFYGAIFSAKDWNGIKPGTSQNFAVVGDIDFNDIPMSDQVTTNLSFNKLLGIYGDYENEDGSSVKRGPIIKNFDNVARGQVMRPGDALISDITSEVRYLSFDNIRLKNNSGSTGSYFGIIKYLNGEMYGHLLDDTVSNEYINFTNITIDNTGGSYVGCIVYNKSPYIRFVRAKNIDIYGSSYVGSIIGYSQGKPKYDFYGSNIVVRATSGYVGGLIGYEYGGSGNKNTYDIAVIGVNVKGSYYVGGAIGYGTSQQASVIGKNSIYKGYTLNSVEGSSYYVGGIFGYQGRTTAKLYAENLNVTGAYYVGGISGGCSTSSTTEKASAININVNATSSSGHAGGIIGYGGYIYDSVVAGGMVYSATGYRVGGISGYTYGSIQRCHVGPLDGHKTYVEGKYHVGGISGYATSISNCFTNADITGQYGVGGITGYGANSITNNIVGGSKITSTGYTTQSVTSRSPNPETSGKTFKMAYVGGAIGQLSGLIYGPKNVVVAEIIVEVNGEDIDVNDSTYAGYGYYAGGYLNSYQTSKQVYNSETKQYERVYYYVDYCLVMGDRVTKHNFTTEVNATSSSVYAYPRIYEGTTLNGVPLKDATSTSAHSIHTVNYGNISKRTDGNIRVIDVNTKYYNDVYSFVPAAGESPTGLTRYPYASTLSVRYIDSTLFDPLLSESEEMIYAVNSMEEIVGQIDTVTSAALPDGGTIAGRPDFHVLPDFDVYASDVDKINIEFANVDPYTYIKVNGKKYYVNQNTFTFYYDFKEDFKVEIGDGINSKEVTISVEEVKNGVSVVGEYYYYLEDGEIITNQPKDLTKDQEAETSEKEESSNTIEDQIGEIIAGGVAYKSDSSYHQLYTSGINLSFLGNKQKSLAESDTSTLINNATNIYGDEILLDNQNIYDISTGETKENSFDNLTLVNSTKPLYEFTYANQKIQTYYNYSIIDGKYIDKQVYVKNGKLEVVEQGLQGDKSSILVDSYNNKSFLVYLGNDGKLHSLKDNIEYPKNFKNINIKGISTNLTSNTNMMLVEYKDGSKVIFNYVTGQLISSHSDEPISLEDYVKQYLEISTDELFSSSKVNSKYEQAKKLAEKLNQNPIEKVLSGEEYYESGALLDNNKYTVVYDPLKGDYYVYEIPSESDSGQVRLTETLSTSIDSVIDSNPVLIEYYKGDSYSKVSTISSIIITIAVITGIVGAVIYLSKYFKKQKQKEA